MAQPNNYPSYPPAYPQNNYPPQGDLPYQQQNVQFPLQPYRYTREEQKVLIECASESFYRRCLPFMTALGLGAYYGVHMGYLKAHPTYAAGPKVAGGVIIGFIAGKLSYKNQCEEKILRLPGGKLKEQILRKRNPQSWSDDGGVYRDASGTYAMPPYIPVPFRSNEQSTAFEQDSERHHDTFDDSFEIRSGDSSAEDSEDLPRLVSPVQSTSYAELRNRNREEYDARSRQYRSGPIDDHPSFAAGYTPPLPPNDRSSRADAYQSPTASADRLSKSSVYQTPTGGFDQYNHSVEHRVPNQQRTLTPRKNFYGDVIEK